MKSPGEQAVYPAEPGRRLTRDYCGIQIRAIGARRPVPRERWTWLRLALGHVGYPVLGWDGDQESYTWGGTIRASGAEVRQAILDLWENERPGFPIEVRVTYG